MREVKNKRAKHEAPGGEFEKLRKNEKKVTQLCMGDGFYLEGISGEDEV